jgi:dihydroflavonol-4-reductase
MYFDCSKAVRELRMPQNPVERALEKAIEWFRSHGYIKSFHEALNV